MTFQTLEFGNKGEQRNKAQAWEVRIMTLIRKRVGILADVVKSRPQLKEGLLLQCWSFGSFSAYCCLP